MSVEIAGATLASLQERLERLEFYLLPTDNEDEDRVSKLDVRTRLGRIEARFTDIRNKSPQARELLDIYALLPESITSRPEDELTQPSTSTNISTSDKETIVLTSSNAIQNTSNQLAALEQLDLPDSRGYASLVAIRGRIARASAVQQRQIAQVEQLRRESAEMLAHWYGESVLQSNESIAEWSERLGRVEQRVRRREVAAKRDREAI